MTVKGLTTPLSRWLRCSYLFVQVRGTWAWSPTRLIPWFSKTKGNIYATFLHHPFLFNGKPTHAQEVARRIPGAVSREAYAKSSQDLISRQLADFWHRCRKDLRTSQDIPSTHHKLLSLALHYFPFSSPPLHPCCFIRPFSIRLFLLASCVLVCWIVCHYGSRQY